MLIGQKATIPSDTYVARQSIDGITWNDIDQINNAPCQTFVFESGNDIEIQTVKSHALGEMKIRYIKNEGSPLKTQMEVTNTSGLNDRYFSFYQLIEVPQNIKWGTNEIDLTTKNNNVYDRDFLKSNRDKFLQLANKIQYDFTLGLDNLESVTVLWDGTKAVLQFDYSHNAQILPDGETYIVDPVFLEENNLEATVVDFDANSICDDAGGSNYGIFSTISLWVIVYDVDEPSLDCTRAWWEFDTSSLPTQALFSNVTMYLTVYANNLNNANQTTNTLITSFQPSTRTFEQVFDDIDNDITLALVTPIPLGNNTILYDAAAILAIQNNYEVGWLGFGMKQSNETAILGSGGDKRWRFCGTLTTTCGGNPGVGPQLTITYTAGSQPDAVDDLEAINIEATMLDLIWTQPFINGTLGGYQINFTTPHGLPQSVIINDTGTNVTNYSVIGLVQLTDYSFRVGVWMAHNNFTNMTGNILNTTTLGLGNFTVGFFSINASAPDARDFKYTRIDVSATQTNLEVTFPTTFNASCNFSYQFARTNDTYYNLATVPVNLGEDMATFQFQNQQNEIVNVLCMDENSNVSAPYLLTITNFPLLQQFQNFASGVYGTEGQIGAIDLITLSVIIVMMVGFNRVNESVGAIFAVIILGFFTFFDIIEWFSFMFGTFAVVIMLTIASTRKM